MDDREYCVIKTDNPETRALLLAIAEADEFLEREWSRITREVFWATDKRFMAEIGLDLGDARVGATLKGVRDDQRNQANLQSVRGLDYS